MGALQPDYFPKLAELIAGIIEERRLITAIEAKVGTPAQQKQLKELTWVLMACTPYEVVVGSWALMLCWNWFMAPTLDLPVITWLAALCLGWFLRCLRNTVVRPPVIEFASMAEGIKQTQQAITHTIVSPLFAAAIGYLIHLFQAQYLLH
jgi:hypothetical protein